MPQKYDIAGLGNAIVDIIASVDDRFLLTHRIAKGGMTLIDEFHARELRKTLEDKSQTLSSPHEAGGGSVANSMAGVASLGLKGLYVGKVYDDRLGGVFADSMTSLGVHYPTTRASAGSHTAYSVIAVTPDGQRSMSTFLGACRELMPEDVEEAEIAQASLVYIEGYLWDQPGSMEASMKAIRAARAAGGKVALSMSDSLCVGRHHDDYLKLLKDDLNIIIANEDEAKALFEEEDFDKVVEQAKAWGGIAALTRSEKGCIIVQEGQVHIVPAVPPARLVDTTGAGDQFAAGFLSGLVRGKSLADCGRLGALAAAEVISHYGARPEASLKALAEKTGLA
jgi:sugar/nucleoside kinase (ribokinase family)